MTTLLPLEVVKSNFRDNLSIKVLIFPSIRVVTYTYYTPWKSAGSRYVLRI